MSPIVVIVERRTENDFAEQDWLLGSEAVVTDEFEDGEEHADDLAAKRLSLEQGGEPDFLFPPNEISDLLDVNLNGCLVIADAGAFFDLLPLEHTSQRTDEIPQLNLLDAIARRITAIAGTVVGKSGISFLPFGRPFLQRCCGLLEAFVLQQLLYKTAARVIGQFHLDSLGFLGFRFSEHQPAFDLDQRTGHGHKIPDEIKVQKLQDLDELLKLPRQSGDRQFTNVHLIPPYEVQQQIERASEQIQFDAVHTEVDEVVGRSR